MHIDRNTVIRRLSSSFGIGYLPAAGTWASALTLGLVFLLPFEMSALYVFVVAAILGFALAPMAKDVFKAKDPSAFVLDEWAGMSLCLASVPDEWWVYALTFAVFRIFDIHKPFGIRQVDKMHHPSCIMWDDFLAALYTIATVWVLLQLLRWTNFFP